jgi:uncharacterized protein (TIGR02117 family)
LLQPYGMLLLLAVFLTSALAGCRAAPGLPSMADQPGGRIIYVIGRDWHTDVAVPASELTGPLGGLKRIFPGAQYFSFGFGERNYVLARKKTFADMLLASWPSPGLMMVTALRAPPAEAFGPAHTVSLRVSEAGRKALLAFVDRYFDLGSDGDLRVTARGPYPGSLFFGSLGTYSAIYTCNTWTADALRAAGLPVAGTGVLFAAQVMQQVREVSMVQTRDVEAFGRSSLLQTEQTGD